MGIGPEQEFGCSRSGVAEAEAKGTEAEEIAEVDLEDLGDVLHRDIERDKARTANALAKWLVIAIVLSFPFYCAVALLLPKSPMMAFERWLAILAALTNLAVGFYFGSQVKGKRGTHD